MNIEQNINSFTLKEISIEAAQLWEELEQLDSNEGDVEQVIQQLFEVQGAQERKIDAIAYVADQLKLDVEVWQSRLEAITLLHTTVINRKQKQLESLKTYLLFLNQTGVLQNCNPGLEREITFQNNPPKVVLKLEPENPRFPEEFRAVRVEYRPLNKQILEAHKQGYDVSEIADIEVGRHVRFKHCSKKK
ncbi:MAG: siphovirus Gp157 family protein [Rhizonema sp. NSF051]|nr:siphovirus Gp157 family protein [Rhizonema sp. NSF051]